MELVVRNNGSSIIQMTSVDIKYLFICFILDIQTAVFSLDEDPSFVVRVGWLGKFDSSLFVRTEILSSFRTFDGLYRAIVIFNKEDLVWTVNIGVSQLDSFSEGDDLQGFIEVQARNYLVTLHEFILRLYKTIT